MSRSLTPQTLAAPPPVQVNFDGIPATGFLPPDTVGAVGPKHYIQMVDTAFAVFDKAGNLLAGPLPINALWAAFGGACEKENNGDPIVRYDHLADRWLISQFALPGPDLHECIAISRTGDPVAGGWFLYDFPTIDTASGAFVFRTTQKSVSGRTRTTWGPSAGSRMVVLMSGPLIANACSLVCQPAKFNST